MSKTLNEIALQLKEANKKVQLIPQPNDSPFFAYHLHLMSQLEAAINSEQVEKYHFNLLRNILEKTATFLVRTRGSKK